MNLYEYAVVDCCVNHSLSVFRNNPEIRLVWWIKYVWILHSALRELTPPSFGYICAYFNSPRCGATVPYSAYTVEDKIRTISYV